MSLSHGVVVSSRLVEVPVDDGLDDLAGDGTASRTQALAGLAPSQPRARLVQECVGRLMELCGAGVIPAEKRSHRRFPFRISLAITPVNNITGKVDDLKSFAAFGIDLSSNGLCFLARQLVAARRAVVCCQGPDHQPVNLLFEPRWVRFTRGGWYQTGGRLIDVLSDAPAPPPTLRLFEPPPDLDKLTHNVRT